MTAPADLLRSHLDETADRLLWQRGGRRYDLARVRRVLRAVLTERGFISVSVNPSLDPLITAYLDEHQAFERVSGDEPLWEPRAKMKA